MPVLPYVPEPIPPVDIFTHATEVPLVTLILVQPRTSVTVPVPAPHAIPSNLVPSATISRPSTVPVTAILPHTCKGLVGVAVPIPTLPALTKRALVPYSPIAIVSVVASLFTSIIGNPDA